MLSRKTGQLKLMPHGRKCSLGQEAHTEHNSKGRKSSGKGEMLPFLCRGSLPMQKLPPDIGISARNRNFSKTLWIHVKVNILGLKEEMKWQEEFLDLQEIGCTIGLRKNNFLLCISHSYTGTVGNRAAGLKLGGSSEVLFSFLICQIAQVRCASKHIHCTCVCISFRCRLWVWLVFQC